jgi:hypothetical protein
MILCEICVMQIVEHIVMIFGNAERNREIATNTANAPAPVMIRYVIADPIIAIIMEDITVDVENVRMQYVNEEHIMSIAKVMGLIRNAHVAYIRQIIPDVKYPRYCVIVV